MPRTASRRFISIATGAGACDVTTGTTRQWTAEGTLPAYRVGPDLIRINQADLDRITRLIPAANADSGRSRQAPARVSACSAAGAAAEGDCRVAYLERGKGRRLRLERRDGRDLILESADRAQAKHDAFASLATCSSRTHLGTGHDHGGAGICAEPDPPR
jgi:excisionase family DNA binding protein